LLEPLIERVARGGIALNMLSLNGGADATFSELENIYITAGGPEVSKRALAIAGDSRSGRERPREPLPGEIYVRVLDRTHETFNVEPTDTVNDLKAKIHDRCGIEPAAQQLVFQGEVLANGEAALSECGLGVWSTVRLYQAGREEGYYERYAPRGSERDYYDDIGDHMYSMTTTSCRRTMARRYGGS
jgi:hypothetical protein